MKRKRIFIATGILILTLLIYLQWGREIKACNAMTQSSSNFRSENVSIVANTLYIRDKTEFAKQMVQRCRDNSFKEIRFSYDLGYPNELTIDVYLNETAWRHGDKNFTIHYAQDGGSSGEYNIVENPDKFVMRIEKPTR